MTAGLRTHVAKDGAWTSSLRAASAYTPEYLAALARWFSALSGLSEAEVLAALTAGEAGEITAALWDAAAENEGIDDLDARLQAELTAATTQMCSAAGVSQWQSLGFGAGFDVRNPYSEAWIPAHAAELVTGVSLVTKEAIAAEVAKGFAEGYPPREMATAIRGMIGLLPSQVSSLRNYEQSLREAGYSEAMIRARLKQRYSRLLTERAEMIARTETINAHAQGALASWRVAQDRKLLPVKVQKVWIATFGSDRTCPICLSLHDAVIGLDGDFSAVYQMTPLSRPKRVTASAPTAHPRCRCRMALRYPKD